MIGTEVDTQVSPYCHVPGLLLKQLHRLTEETQNALGHSPQDVDKDMRQSLVTIFNSRPDMYAIPPLLREHTGLVDAATAMHR